jgi:hypothetical protein
MAQLPCGPPRPAVEATPQFVPVTVPPASAPATVRLVRSKPPRRAPSRLRRRPCRARATGHV